MLKIETTYKGANIFQNGDKFILIYENSKKMAYTPDRDTWAGIEGTPIFTRQLKKFNTVAEAKSFITRNKRFYVGYRLEHYSQQREDIYHTTTFY